MASNSCGQIYWAKNIPQQYKYKRDFKSLQWNSGCLFNFRFYSTNQFNNVFSQFDVSLMFYHIEFISCFANCKFITYPTRTLYKHSQMYQKP